MGIENEDEDRDEDLNVTAGEPDGEVIKVEDDEDDGEQKGKKKVAESKKEVVEEHDEDDADESLGAVENEDGEAESPRGKRRESNAERRERQRAARAAQERELNFLRNRNEQLERRFSEHELSVEQRFARSEYSGIDARIAQVDESLRKADAVIAEAVDAQRGADVAEATNIRDSLRDRKRELLAAKERIVHQVQQRQRAPQIPQPDPVVIENARRWAADKPWMNDMNSEDVAIARVIDEKMASEGLNPRDPAYFVEFDRRLAKRLPHRYAKPNVETDDSDEEEPQPRKRERPNMPPANRTPKLKPGEFYVNAERKQAMIDAGIWDDDKARNRMIKKYQQYDREAAANNRR